MADIVSAFPTSIAMSDSGVQRVAEAYVYAASDTSLTTPLAITDMQGIPITGGKLTTTTGQFPQFKAPAGVTQVLVLSGGRVTLLTDVSVFVGAAVESATAAATSAGASEQARVLSAAAKTLAEKAAADAVAVGNSNDTIIEGRIKDPASKTAVALKSTFVSLAAAAKNPDLLIVGNITRDANQAVTSADVVWPDGKPGTFTALTLSTAFPGAVDSYKITYGSPVTKTYTQPAITRNAAGAATSVPQIVVS